MSIRLAVATSLLIVGGLAASAEAPARSEPGTVLVSGGCGFAFHRDVVGGCVPDRRFHGGPIRLLPPCPRFYHRDPTRPGRSATPTCEARAGRAPWAGGATRRVAVRGRRRIYASDRNPPFCVTMRHFYGLAGYGIPYVVVINLG